MGPNSNASNAKQIPTSEAIKLIDSIASEYKANRKERFLIDQSMQTLAEKATRCDAAESMNEGLNSRIDELDLLHKASEEKIKELELLTKGPEAKVETLGG